MATSNSYNFNVTGLDIITEALGLAGAYSPGESIDASESADVLRTLNMMLKSWQMMTMGIWLNKELNLFLGNSQIKYDLGPTGDHCAINAVKTELAVVAASGASSLTIDGTTGFADTFDRNGIITAVTAAAAGAITLTGALVASGIATLSGERRILIYAAGNESARTFSIVGQDSAGVAVTENITGPNAGTVYSASTYRTITSVTVDAATAGNIEVGQVGDPIGIELDNDTLHWTYIANALSTTPSLVTALTGAAAIDNHVYSYTIRAPRPVQVVECRLHKASGVDVPINVEGRLYYQTLSTKTQTGTPNQVYYDKQLTDGALYVWPAPTDMQDYIKFTARLPIQDMDNLTDDFEVAQEWYLPLAWNLAVLIYPKYHDGRFIDAATALKAEALLDEAKTSDGENTPIYIRIGQGRQ